MLALVALSCARPDSSGETAAPAAPEPAEAGVERHPLREAFFGDLHVHTVYSLDAYINGVRLGPRDAYRFARGEEVALPGGGRRRLHAPLDFAAVTDHSEFFAEMVMCTDAASPKYEEEFCAALRGGDTRIVPPIFARMSRQPPEPHRELCPEAGPCRELAVGPWRDIQAAAAEFDDPGRFTTFVAYEYSPLLVDFGTLHRNLVFRGTAVPDRALSALDLPTQAELWRWLESACTGECEVLAIPHNMNLSWGLLFARTNDDGAAYSVEDLERRARFERIAEVIQMKGSSECALGLGTQDEGCAFEQLFPLCGDGQRTRCAREGSYLLPALIDGLAIAEEHGTNPFQLGMIGSTDTHNAIAGAVEEDRFDGTTSGDAEPPAELFAARNPIYGSPTHLNPGGLAGVWAESNTRGDLFDAMRRRETFATSGTRLRVRFFGGWDYPDDLTARADALEMAYAAGVPMGADLSGTGRAEEASGRSESAGASAGSAPRSSPRFWIWAARGADGAPLDRIEIVKGWTDADGSPRHTVRDAACSGKRSPDPATGRCPAALPAVDLETCSVAETSGAGELSVVWSDPDFDPSRPAFYYVRVLEVPSCRWTTHLARRAGLAAPEAVPATIQERAWSSPIWYRP